jgi:hypothetical protein
MYPGETMKSQDSEAVQQGRPPVQWGNHAVHRTRKDILIDHALVNVSGHHYFVWNEAILGVTAEHFWQCEHTHPFCGFQILTDLFWLVLRTE